MRKHFIRAVALAAVVGGVGVAVAPAHADDDRRDDLAELAAKQSQAWENGLTATTPLSSDTCLRTDGHVVLAPVMTDRSTNFATVSCTIGARDRLLVDLGGFVPTEDANECGDFPGACFAVNDVDTPFRPDTLVPIAGAINDLFGPFAVSTLDGQPLVGETLAVGPFKLRIPRDAPQYQDSVRLGHPGRLAASYAGHIALMLASFSA